MARILVVDDERAYRVYLQRFLDDLGHEVRVAETGRDAIAIGSLWRPDVALVDWMLKADLHGLHVAAALRAVRPDTRVILITGFPSADLRASSEDLSDFVSKPFEPEQIRASVEAVLAGPPPPQRHVGYGVYEIDREGRLTYASPFGLELVGRAGAKTGERLFDLFTTDGAALEAGARDWTAVTTRNGDVWRLRTQPPADGGRRLVVVIPSEARRDVPLVEIVLGIEAPAVERAYTGRVLVVDDDRFYRMTVTTLLDQLGVPCFSAGTHAQALRLLETDPGLDLVILDYDMPDGDVGGLVRRIRAARPDALLVGNSGGDRRADFAARGVDRYLDKPWRSADLMRLVANARPERAPAAVPRPSAPT